MHAELRRIAKRFLAGARDLPAAQVFCRIKRGALIRFTNNGVHQNGFQDLFSCTLRSLTQKGPVWVESNDLSPEGIRAAINRLKKMAGADLPQSFPQFPRRRGNGGPKATSKEYFQFSSARIPEMAAWAIEKAVRLIREEKASANGYYSAYERFFYLADAEGREAFHPATAFRFGVTATKGEGKGYHSFYHPDPHRLKVGEVVKEALGLAREAAGGEVTLVPGEYECVFSPRAFLELIEPLRRHFDAALAGSGKSVFSGGLARRFFSPAFSLYEDLKCPGQFGLPFDAEGLPRKRVPLVEKGVLKALLSEGHSTRGWMENPCYPQNLTVPKGAMGRDEIFRNIRRGIFINKIWYHTLVREGAMEVTGLATAGSLFIEKGRIRGRAAGLRYHDSLFSILRSLKAASRERLLLKDGEMGAAFFPYLWTSRLRVVA